MNEFVGVNSFHRQKMRRSASALRAEARCFPSLVSHRARPESLSWYHVCMVATLFITAKRLREAPGEPPFYEIQIGVNPLKRFGTIEGLCLFITQASHEIETRDHLALLRKKLSGTDSPAEYVFPISPESARKMGFELKQPAEKPR